MNRKQIIMSLETLLAASPRPAVELEQQGVRQFDVEDAMRAVLKGQFLLISPACVRDILRELKGGES